MDAAQTALRRFRNCFVVWFVIQSVAGTVVAAHVVDGLRRDDLLGHVLGRGSVDLTIAAGILVSLLLLLIALLVIASLLELRPWARIVCLVFGWITVVGAAVNLLTLPGSAGLLAPAVEIFGGDWRTVAMASAGTKVVDLAFWSWAIHTLQFNRTIRAAFV